MSNLHPKNKILIIGPHHIGDNIICALSLFKIFEMQRTDLFFYVTHIQITGLFLELFDNVKIIGIPPYYSTDIRSAYHGVAIGLKRNNYDVIIDLRSDVTAGLIMLLSSAQEKWGGPIINILFFGCKFDIFEL